MFFGAVGTLMGIYFTFYLNNAEYKERERDRKIDLIYVAVVRQNLVDSIQNYTIGGVVAGFKDYKEETSKDIIKLQQSMMDAQEQLSKIQESEMLSDADVYKNRFKNSK